MNSFAPLLSSSISSTQTISGSINKFVIVMARIHWLLNKPKSPYYTVVVVALAEEQGLPAGRKGGPSAGQAPDPSLIVEI
jgi:hypothetical protein